MLSLPNIKIPFDSVEEFLQQDEIQAVVHPGALAYQELSVNNHLNVFYKDLIVLVISNWQYQDFLICR